MPKECLNTFSDILMMASLKSGYIDHSGKSKQDTCDNHVLECVCESRLEKGHCY